ncbi:MAG: hypothetical protein GF311_02050 [Candidatus Lokiarchaeota archaeon]|nr:hypothetical protein [Candidatus Lokiarchaeota archaeon]
MGEDLYGKFGLVAAKIGVMLLAITIFSAFTFGLFIPEIITMFLVFLYIVNILAIILGIVGILRDTLRENAVRALVAGIIFLIASILITVAFNWFRTLVA